MPVKNELKLVYSYIQSNLRDKIEYISGKWFFRKKEIKNINDFMTRVALSNDEMNYKYFRFNKRKDVDEWLEIYKQSSAPEVRPMGWWYESEIAREGRELAESGKEISYSYQLSLKQLIMIHIMLYCPYEEVMFINTGIGGSGKSTFGNLVCQLFENDVSACSLESLSNEFNVAEAINHRLIYADELSGESLSSPTLKTMISKQLINRNPKNKTPDVAQSQSTLFFNCNKLPKFDISDSGVMRRIIYNHMNTKIQNPDTSLNRKQFSHDELVAIAAAAFKTSIKNWRLHFTEETHKLLAKDNSVYICRDKVVYEDYVRLCVKKGLKPYGEPNWLEIREVFQEWGLIEPDDLPF